MEITGPKGDKVVAPVKDNGDGTYRVDYTPERGGPTKIAVTLRGKPVANSPYTINVRDQAADPMFTKAWGPGIQAAESGVPTEFYIKAYNRSVA